MKITGAELFVKALKAEGVSTLFAYPGGQAIDLFDALYGEKDIDVILPRHEQGLIHAADGYARVTGKPGVCLVTSGPGATNLVTGIATANYDSVPLVCFTGQVATGLLGKKAFQEVDIVDITKSICKEAVTVRNREELGETIRKAFATAVTGKPGVVVVDLPKDIQQALGSDYYEPYEKAGVCEQAHYIVEKLEPVWKLLNAARRPLLLAGGGVRIARAQQELQQFVNCLKIPVVTTIMGRGAVPTTQDLYVGNIGIHGSYAANMAVSKCDVLLAIGTRFNDRITGRTDTFASGAKIIHIDIDETCLERNIRTDLSFQMDAGEALGALLQKAEPLETGSWLAQIGQWKREHPLAMTGKGLSPQEIIEAINECFTDAVIATDVGQNQLWATQYLALDDHKQMLTSGGLGTMGYGFPAAIGAKLGQPEKDVLVISGDGGMQMNIQELATAVVYELPVIVCILNNGYLGNVRQWQEMFYDRRYAGTCMRFRRSCERYGSNFGCACASGDNGEDVCPPYTPDFIQLAQSYGAKGIRVARKEQIQEAFAWAKQNKKTPTIIEFIVEREGNVLPIVRPGDSLDKMTLP